MFKVIATPQSFKAAFKTLSQTLIEREIMLN